MFPLHGQFYKYAQCNRHQRRKGSGSFRGNMLVIDCFDLVMFAVTLTAFSLGIVSQLFMVTCVSSVQKCGPAFHLWFGYLCLFCPEVWVSFPPVVWLLVFVPSRSVGQLSTCGLVTAVCSVQKCGPAFHLWFGYYCLFCPEVWASFPPVVWLLTFCPEVWASFPPVVWLLMFCPEVWVSFPSVVWLLVF